MAQDFSSRSFFATSLLFMTAFGLVAHTPQDHKMTAGDALNPIASLDDPQFSGSVVFSSGNLNLAIPDLSSVSDTIVASAAGIISDVDVSIRVNHVFDGDLRFTLTSPNGVVVPIALNVGAQDDNFGSGSPSCSGMPTRFDDESPLPIVFGPAPFTGTYRPTRPLSAFDGGRISGDWILRVEDVLNGDTGRGKIASQALLENHWPVPGLHTPKFEPKLEAERSIVGRSRSSAHSRPCGSSTTRVEVAVFRPAEGVWYIRGVGR